MGIYNITRSIKEIINFIKHFVDGSKFLNIYEE